MFKYKLRKINQRSWSIRWWMRLPSSKSKRSYGSSCLKYVPRTVWHLVGWIVPLKRLARLAWCPSSIAEKKWLELWGDTWPTSRWFYCQLYSALKDANLKWQACPAYLLLCFGLTFIKEVKMDGELIYKRDALIKRRAELIQEIATCADAIERIDTELQQDFLVGTRVSFSCNCQ